MKSTKINFVVILISCLGISCSKDSDANTPPNDNTPTLTATVTTIAGDVAGDVNATGTAARFRYPTSITIDAAGNMYVADRENHKFKKITPQGVVTTFAGSSFGDVNGTGSAAKFTRPVAIYFGVDGNFYAVDDTSKIKKITAGAAVTTFAGSVVGDTNGTGAAAQFNTPRGVVQDASGNVYVADDDNHKIKKITPAGVVTTFAGSTQGFANGTGSSARFNHPTGLTIDSNGNLYVADRFNFRIRKITPAGIVTTLVGNSFSGDVDGTGDDAKFYNPYDLVFTNNLIYVVDRDNSKIKRVTMDGVVTTIAGTTSGFSDGKGNVAQFSYPRGITADVAGNLYIADYNNHKIRKITFQ